MFGKYLMAIIYVLAFVVFEQPEIIQIPLGT